MTNLESPSFDSAPVAKPLFKERALWVLVIGLFFFALYGAANQIASMTAPHPVVAFGFEGLIPFVPELVVPYMSSDLVFVIAFLLAQNRSEIQKLGIRCGLAIVISVAFFIGMPLQVGFDRPDVTGWTRAWFDLLSLDQPYNQFPSLHVSLGFIAWWSIRKRLGLILRFMVVVWFLFIMASTLLVYQHQFIDLIGGVGVIALVYRLVPERGTEALPLRFVTPRHLHMALRYMVGAVAMILLAFAAAGLEGGLIYLAILPGWIAVSLILVAGAYVLGWNGFAGKRQGTGGGGYGLHVLILLWPYLIGSYLNWLYWRPKVPQMSEVVPGLWIGRLPRGSEWDTIQGAGVASVVDLVPELRSRPLDDIVHLHIPMLDIAIPDPAVLHRAVEEIEQASHRGPVLVHCGLGMSRSVLAVCAWLMSKGDGAAEALAKIDAVHPARVRRPYMSISLELYAAFRKEKGA